MPGPVDTLRLPLNHRDIATDFGGRRHLRELTQVEHPELGTGM
jgi:hypothetical protein